MKKSSQIVFFFVFFVILIGACTKSPSKSEKATHVLLISIDGFRHDYLDKFKPKNLLKLINQGVVAESLIPPFPSKTFTSHYTMATGLYPINHGIVANHFFDSKENAMYSARDKTTVQDGSWYGGTPLWVAAEDKGIKTASYFWIGSEAKINRKRPSYYKQFSFPTPKYSDRIKQVVDWFKMPFKKRPKFITLYFEGVDFTSHFKLGDDKAIKVEIDRVDEALGSLFEKLKKLPFKVNVIVVSDHGMAKVSQNKRIFLEDYLSKNDFQNIKVVGKGSLIYLSFKDKKNINNVYRKLKNAHQHMKVYVSSPNKNTLINEQLNVMPKDWMFSGNNKTKLEKIGKHRLGDLMLVVDQPYQIFTSRKVVGVPREGTHGYDPFKYKDMHGIFIAKGPLFKKDLRIKSFENIHLYPMIMKALGLKTLWPIDGDLDVLDPIFVK